MRRGSAACQHCGIAQAVHFREVERQGGVALQLDVLVEVSNDDPVVGRRAGEVQLPALGDGAVEGWGEMRMWVRIGKKKNWDYGNVRRRATWEKTVDWAGQPAVEGGPVRQGFSHPKLIEYAVRLEERLERVQERIVERSRVPDYENTLAGDAWGAQTGRAADPHSVIQQPTAPFSACRRCWPQQPTRRRRKSILQQMRSTVHLPRIADNCRPRAASAKR